MEKKVKRPLYRNSVERELMRTAEKIRRRKEQGIPEKEAALIAEIRKLLETKVVNAPRTEEWKNFSLPVHPKPLNRGSIPLSSPGLTVFKDESVFSLFNKDSLKLKNFVASDREFPKIFGHNDSMPSEDCFRELIAHRVADNLMPDDKKKSCVNLYVLYLMSVHDQPAFVAACFDFLVARPFRLESKHIFPILVNFGADLEDYSCDKALIKKLSGSDEGIKKEDGENKQFPYYNVEMVGKLLVHYVTGDYLKADSDTKHLVRALAKIPLDTKVKSGSLLPIYSLLVSRFCERITGKIRCSEMADWLHFHNEHLMHQLEISRIISRTVCPKLHDALTFRMIRTIIKSKTLTRHPVSMIRFFNLVVRKLKYKDLTALEFYSLFQLINTSLPSLIANVEDSREVIKSINHLEAKIIQAEDSVDLIRIKLEVAKSRNLVSNCVNNRFKLVEKPAKSSSRRK